MMNRPKWMRGLSAREIKHLAEGNAFVRPTLRSLKENLKAQHERGFYCFDCSSIARKLEAKGVQI